MLPCIVLDTETTGFPNNGAGFCGRVVEVGAVVVTEDARVVSPISFLVRQPEAHLRSWQAKKAMAVHGIAVEEILRSGLDPLEAAPRFARWVEKVQAHHGVQHIRAYNQPFDFWFLERSPWELFERTEIQPGEDIRDTAKHAMGRTSGPSLAKAVAHAQESGAPVEWQSKAHRALEDARMAALVAIALGGDQEITQRVA